MICPAGIATQAFLELEVDAFRRDPTGEDGSFQPFKLALDSGQTGFGSHAELARSNCAALFKTPYWLRRDVPTPALWQLPLSLERRDPVIHVEAVDGSPRRGAAVEAAGVLVGCGRSGARSRVPLEKRATSAATARRTGLAG